MSLPIITRVDGEAVELAVKGEIDMENAHELREAVSAALVAHQPKRIEINMRETTFIDSVGISALVGAYQSAAVSEVALVVTQPRNVVYRQLWISGLIGLFGSPDPHDPDTGERVRT